MDYENIKILWIIVHYYTAKSTSANSQYSSSVSPIRMH